MNYTPVEIFARRVFKPVRTVQRSGAAGLNGALAPRPLGTPRTLRIDNVAKSLRRPDKRSASGNLAVNALRLSTLPFVYLLTAFDTYPVLRCCWDPDPPPGASENQTAHDCPADKMRMIDLPVRLG
jgi:hypothetical protein